MFCWEPCVITCAARLQLLNFAVKEQQAASWQGTFCSFLFYLPIPSDQALGNNWHLPDLAVFMCLLTNEVSSNRSEFACRSDSTQVCLELLGAFVQALSLFNLCIKTLSKWPSCCPHQRKKPLKDAVPVRIIPAQVRGEIGQQESIRQQELLSFKKANCCQSQWLPTCKAMQSSSCCALSSAEARKCSSGSLGAAAPSSSTGQSPVVGCQCQLCFLTLYRAQNLQSTEKKVPSFHRVYLICVFLLLSHHSQCHQLPCYFRACQGALQSPHLTTGARGALGFLCLPTHKHPPISSPQIQVLYLSKEHIPHETKNLTCF